MAEVAISELAKATGFPASALRYYERIGLLSPIGRSAGGYRLYDEGAADRLTFIARAKRLGLNLEEITELVALWEDGPCLPVHERLRALLDDKVERLDAQIDELVRFRAQLAHVHRSLRVAEPAADRCGPGCGCDADLPAHNEVRVSLRCTLDAGDGRQRKAEWQRMLERVEERRPGPEGMSLRFAADPALIGELAALTARELECCAFFTFTLKIDADAAWLTISAPAEAIPMVAEFFGSPDA